MECAVLADMAEHYGLDPVFEALPAHGWADGGLYSVPLIHRLVAETELCFESRLDGLRRVGR